MRLAREKLRQILRKKKKTCFGWGSKEYMLGEFPHKDNIPRSQWFDRTNREFNHHQNNYYHHHHHHHDFDDNASVASDGDVSATSVNSTSRAAWSGAQMYSEACFSGQSRRGNDANKKGS